MFLGIWEGVKSALKVQTSIIDNAIFRLHYRVTVFFLVTSALLITATQYFGDPIDCLTTTSSVEKVIDTFCWTHHTYSVVQAFDGKVGSEIAYHGVDNRHGKTKVYHTYYQWVWFILFLQAGLFYIPRYLWKVCEGGRIKVLSEGLKTSSLAGSGQDSKKTLIVDYLTKHSKLHQMFVCKYIFCEFANFVNVVAQIYLVDAFLGGEFRKFGVKVIQFALMGDSPDRADPMIRVFPRMTKCDFHLFGPSGDVQPIYAYCILPLNIINEKIFIFAWFWFVILATLTALALVYRIVTLFSSTLRNYCLQANCVMGNDDCIIEAGSKLALGDWFMLYTLSKNVETMYMRDILKDIQIRCSEKSLYQGPGAPSLVVSGMGTLSKKNLIDDDTTYV